MVVDLSTSVSNFLEASAAKQPTPGGGSAAALTGALAASMGEMVLNYSVGKKSLEQFQAELKPLLERFHKARLLCQEMVVEDQVAYEEVSRLRKLPPDSPERIAQWDAAVLRAVRVPQSIAATCVAVLELCDQAVMFVNPYLLSDLAVSADLAMAAARCGIYNVRVNLPDITDDKTRTNVESSITDLLLRASRVIQRVSPRIWERVEMEA